MRAWHTGLLTKSLPGQGHPRVMVIGATDAAKERTATSSRAPRRGDTGPAANSTVGVAKESHPFRGASLIEKCNKSSSLIFDELFEGTNGKPNG